jgi:hypothetical protein
MHGIDDIETVLAYPSNAGQWSMSPTVPATGLTVIHTGFRVDVRVADAEVGEAARRSRYVRRRGCVGPVTELPTAPDLERHGWRYHNPTCLVRTPPTGTAMGGRLRLLLVNPIGAWHKPSFRQADLVGM